MLQYLWLVPAVPLAGFVILAIFSGSIAKKAIAIIGTVSVAVSMVLAILITIAFIHSTPAVGSYTQTLWTWMKVGNFEPGISFYLDALSIVMMLVVTVVGFLIHLYSTEFMRYDEGYGRFFAYMNLFVGSMLILVLADNLLFLYLGWEGVGLCSYLLIGFWYKQAANSIAGIKAFVVTRVGDTAMAIGLFLLFTQFGTLQIQPLMEKLSQIPAGSSVCTAAAVLLLIGALGKSAQLPLQVWLPDAMAGPAPVSALIHAATMVTAGVYLIARTNVLYTQAPVIQLLVAIIGALTLLIGGFGALTQTDIKRVLAYSTISQIGYMFLALGVGAWSAAIFHFMTHAFFKSLLFLAAGAVIISLNGEHNIFKMGGLYRKMPLIFYAFLAGCASLSALPLVTAGFYSKDMILSQVWSSKTGAAWLWAAGIVGALLTSIYSFRLLFIVFFRPGEAKISRQIGWAIKLVLIILAIFSIFAGFGQIPRVIGNVEIISGFLKKALPAFSAIEINIRTETIVQVTAGIISLLGIYIAYLLFMRKYDFSQRLANSTIGSLLHRLWFADWGFDWLYDKIFVRPYRWFADFDRDDYIDKISDAIEELSKMAHRGLSLSQTGKIRWIAGGITIGAIAVIAIVELL